MQINLNETEIKQAITDYLSARLVNTVMKTGINMTAGRTPAGFTATIDVTFTMPDWLAEQHETVVDESPVPEEKKTVAKVVQPKTVVKPEPKSQKILEDVAKDLGVEANIGTKAEAKDNPFNTDPVPKMETKVVKEEAPIIEGGNTMTENFELAASADNVAAPIVDDVEDLFNC